MKSIYGFKKEQIQAFEAQGKRLAITKITVYPLTVIGVKTPKKDGYQAIRVGIGNKKRLTRPIIGSFKNLKLRPQFIRELKIDKSEAWQKGDTVKVEDVFKVGDKVKIQSTTKGRGFAGVMKRWGFKGGPRTHGQSDRERAPGSIGQGTDPGRVWKGKKMPGHMGAQTHTVSGLQLVKIDLDKNEIWVKGLVSGHRNSLVKITKTGPGKFSGFESELNKEESQTKRSQEKAKKEKTTDKAEERKEDKPTKGKETTKKL